MRAASNSCTRAQGRRLQLKVEGQRLIPFHHVVVSSVESERGQVNPGSTSTAPASTGTLSKRGQPGVNLHRPSQYRYTKQARSTQGQTRVSLGSTWGRPGVNLHHPTRAGVGSLAPPLPLSSSSCSMAHMYRYQPMYTDTLSRGVTFPARGGYTSNMSVLASGNASTALLVALV